MADNSTRTIVATFNTRASADAAIEHLVQKQGIARPDIFVLAIGSDNSAGTEPSGGDVSREGGNRKDAALGGEIEISVDIDAEQEPAVQRILGDAGAIRMSAS